MPRTTALFTLTFALGTWPPSAVSQEVVRGKKVKVNVKFKKQPTKTKYYLMQCAEEIPDTTRAETRTLWRLGDAPLVEVA